jgi:ketosteroid isomerase-like protein
MKRMTLVLLCLLSCSALAWDKSARQSLIETIHAQSKVPSDNQHVDQFAAFCTEDVVTVPPGGPVLSGRKAWRKFLQSSFEVPGFEVRQKSLDVSVSNDGTLGYAVSGFVLSFPPPRKQGRDQLISKDDAGPGAGAKMTLTGRGVSIWRRAKGGAWKCVYQTWNFEEGG